MGTTEFPSLPIFEYILYMKRNGTIALKGAHCGSCAYTIEHLGRKIAGIRKVRVNTADQKAYVEYEGSEKVLDDVVSIVDKIGYSAQVLSTDEGIEE